MDWRFGSSSRVPALQVQSPEFKPHSRQKKIKLGMVMHTCNHSNSGDMGKRTEVQGWPQAKTQDPIQKITKGVTQVTEHLSSKHEALSSNPSITKQKRNT
jgi:hypothetical protein